jgi:hypothetical protein
MHTAAVSHADRYCQTIPAKLLTLTREIVEKDLSSEAEQPLTLTQRAWAEWFLKHQAPPNDPIVEHRRLTRTEAERHARGVRARILSETRHAFGKGGDLIADEAAFAVTGVTFSRDDRRGRFKR